MAYHNFCQSSLTADERRAEALKIIELLQDYQDELHSHEVDMCHRITDGQSASVKMLFWLRDIKDRVM